MSVVSVEFPARTNDGHRYVVLARIPENARANLLWIPALGVAARHYLAFAEALALHGIAVYLHEWRGNGSSSLRANRDNDWGYRELLTQDLPVSDALMREHGGERTAIIGGHSLGGQIASCYLGLHADLFQHLWLVASGTPHWHMFPPPRGWLLPAFYRFAIWIAQRRGALPGRKLGFGGEEARSLIRDWGNVGLSGHYAAAHMDIDLDTTLANIRASVRGVLLKNDWFAPPTSLAGLLAKMPLAGKHVTQLDAKALGATADHFAWMKKPGVVARMLDQSLSY